MDIFEGSSNLIINFKDVIKPNNMKRKKKGFYEELFYI